jgi:hypothetical protein
MKLQDSEEYITCITCDAMGPSTGMMDEVGVARKLWNQRAG